MKMLYLTNTFAPFHGGVARFSTELCRALAALGHEVTVVTEALGPLPQHLDPLTIKRYKGHRRLPARMGTPLRNLAAVRRTMHQVRRDNYDVIMVGTWRTFGPMLALTGRPYVMVAYGAEVLTPFARRRPSRHILKWVGSRAHCIAAISRCTAETVQEVLGSCAPPTGVIGCGIDPAYWRHLEPIPARGDGRMVLSVGRLSRRKGFDSTVRAFARSAYAEDGQLVLVGTGPMEEELRRIAVEENVAQRVRFLSDVSEAELAGLYRQAEVFMLLNRVVDGDFEGFGLVFLEAALQGVPAIGGRNGGPTDAIEDGRSGYLVDPEDVGGVAACLDRLYRNPDLARELGAYARERVLRCHTWEKVAGRLVDLLQSTGVVEARVRKVCVSQ